MINRLVRGIATLAFAASIATPALAETQTVTDVLNREVEVPAKAERILLGFYFEDFFAVGGPDAYDRVVAISREAWEGWRNLQWQSYVEAVPRIAELTDVGELDAGTFSLETAVAAKPDIAVLAAWQYDVMGDTVGRLEAAGIPIVVLDYNAQTVEKHVTSTLLLGSILGEEARANELADLYAGSIGDIEKRLEGIEARPRVYVELARKGAGEIDNLSLIHI